MFRKLKSVVVFLKIIVSFVLTRSFGKLRVAQKNLVRWKGENTFKMLFQACLVHWRQEHCAVQHRVQELIREITVSRILLGKPPKHP